jgi:hypothetical protein
MLLFQAIKYFNYQFISNNAFANIDFRIVDKYYISYNAFSNIDFVAQNFNNRHFNNQHSNNPSRSVAYNRFVAFTYNRIVAYKTGVGVAEVRGGCQKK